MTFLEKLTYKLFNYWPSYSQCGEDRIVSHLFASLGKTKITYLDIGTNHPKKANNTFLFYLHGANGVCVEPNPILCKKIKKVRPNDVCLNIGIGSTNSDHLDFYVIDTDTLSTFSQKGAEDLQHSGKFKIETVIKIPVLGLNDVIATNFSSTPDFVSLDVEDLNEDIVKAIDFTYRPVVFCVETLLYNVENSFEKISSIKQHFLDNDYSVYADTFINTIFVDNKVFNISWTK